MLWKPTNFPYPAAIMAKYKGNVNLKFKKLKNVIDRTTLTRNFKPLVKRGYIEVVLGEDRRTRVVSLTGRGRQVLRKALPLWKKAQARVVKELGQERWSSLQSNLREVVSLAHKS